MSHLATIQNKIHTVPSIKETVKKWKQLGEKIVFTNGCFDLLHLGHVTYLSEAADLGDRLIVGINSDLSVKQLGKGASRPIKEEDSRLLIIGALEFVDAVILFNEDTPLNIIEQIVPDVLVKGGDYDPDELDVHHPKYIVGSKEVSENGGETKILAFVKGYSTTKLENKIIRSLKENGEG